jgi:AraC-like DNA-binding protein
VRNYAAENNRHIDVTLSRHPLKIIPNLLSAISWKGERNLLHQNQTNWVYQAEGEINRIEACFSDCAFSPHRHDTYTFGVTLEGVQSFDYRGSTRNSLPGNLVVLHPDELHDGRAGTDEHFRYRTIYIEPYVLQDVFKGQALPFIEDGVSSDPRLLRAILPLLDDLENALEPLAFSDSILSLATALRDMTGSTTSQSTANFIAAQEARSYIHEHLTECVTLDDLETMSGQDRWELSRDFRKLFGTSPYRYLTMRRLDRARLMMRSGVPLADTALACGFSDQSHFSRHFKKAFGLTPGKWAKATVC